MTTKTETVTQCARCNGKASKKWFDVCGLCVGVECVPIVEETSKRIGKNGKALLIVLREEYKSMMRVTTTTGMILNGMLKLADMISKGKITKEQFLAVAIKRYRGDDAKKIVSSLSK